MGKDKMRNKFDMEEEGEDNSRKPSNDRRKKQAQKRQIEEAMDEYYENEY
jgi:hypothetical protein